MISNLIIHNFRNYPERNFDFNSDICVIFGNNGAGKTNILEAISLFKKGKGLRSCDLKEMIFNAANNKIFTIFSTLNNHEEIDNCATSYNQIENKRHFQINGSKIGAIKTFPAIIWLTPKMDTLFSDSKSTRRAFLDKIAGDIDHHHSSRLNNYEKCLKERMILLQQNQDKKWLEIIERKIAELGVSIAILRNETIDYLNRAILLSKSNFVKTKIEIIGEIEEMAKYKKSLEVEDLFCQKLFQNRQLDLHSNKSLFGVHRSDFKAILLDKNIAANFCSLGEQKSILIALTIARVRINSFFNLPKAILLLDEIASHLDMNRRKELFIELQEIEAQSFLTGTERDIFKELEMSFSKSVKFIHIA